MLQDTTPEAQNNATPEMPLLKYKLFYFKDWCLFICETMYVNVYVYVYKCVCVYACLFAGFHQFTTNFQRNKGNVVSENVIIRSILYRRIRVERMKGVYPRY